MTEHERPVCVSPFCTRQTVSWSGRLRAALCATHREQWFQDLESGSHDTWEAFADAARERST